MRLSSAATVGIVLGLALITGGCGEDGSSAADKPASTVSTGSTALPKKAQAGRSCNELRGFVGSMSALRDKLAVGLSYDDYLGEVQSVRSIYGEIGVRKLAVGCLVVAAGPAEGAFNLYIDAANTWGDCLATASCSTRSIEPMLQRKWALAARRLTVAQQGLRA